MVSVLTSPYLSAGAPALGEAKGLIDLFYIFSNLKFIIKIIRITLNLNDECTSKADKFSNNDRKIRKVLIKHKLKIII